MTTETRNTSHTRGPDAGPFDPGNSAPLAAPNPDAADVPPIHSVAAPATPAKMKLPSHIPALDGVRGVAVLLVLFCHATQRPFGDAAAINAAFTGALDKGILTLARISWTGVDMFFVLSGFLITGILFDAKGKDHFFRNFYARRTVRIFPLYYITLLLLLVIIPAVCPSFMQGWGEITTSKIWYPLYLSNFSQSIAEQSGLVVTHPVHVSWSLSIEEQFYLCWPLVVFLSNRKTLLKVCAGMFFGSMALRVILLAANRDFWALGFTPCRLDGLAIGAAIALVVRGPTGVGVLPRLAKWMAPASAAAIALLVMTMHQMGYRNGIGQTPGYIVAGTALFALLYGSILVLVIAAARQSWTTRIFAHPILRTFGKYSYAVYLLHLPVMIFVAEHIFTPSRLRMGPTMLPGLLIFYLIVGAGSLGVAILSWNVLEKHFLKLKDYFPMEKKATTAAAWEGKDATKPQPA